MALVLPSILSADFARLGEEIGRMESNGAKMLHLDVMDGHFVPNLTIGPPVVASIRKATRLTLDVHLMITNPDDHILAFLEAGADQISVHQEVTPHLDRTVRAIQSEGARAGVVINPATPVSLLEEIVEIADYVLVMSVNPGFGGQRFIPRSLEKIRMLREWRQARGLGFQIEVDGGVSISNVGALVNAGCDWLVAGSAIFHAADPGEAFATMQREAEAASLTRV
ncbi:MAG: ribulose-phosphate 3-epimerase [Bryobacterales bacterium]|nr:ribulose-phosphate 3-epimerase [Bryobacterales bacterium]